MDVPQPRLIRSPEDAEAVAAEWLRYYGYTDAAITSAGADGGVDVESAGMVAQVKAEMKPIGRPVVQQIYGEAALRDVASAVFSLSGFTPEAAGWADEAGVALFSFDLQGVPVAQNKRATEILTETQGDYWRQVLDQLLSKMNLILDEMSASVEGIHLGERDLHDWLEEYRAAQEPYKAPATDAAHRVWEYLRVLSGEGRRARLSPEDTNTLIPYAPSLREVNLYNDEILDVGGPKGRLRVQVVAESDVVLLGEQSRWTKPHTREVVDKGFIVK
jgi:hypothetical protein